MNLSTQIENLLRNNGYQTNLWMGNTVPTVCFENEAVLGFVFLFKTEEELLSDWDNVQKTALDGYAEVLRNSGEKAWNVYSVFLAETSQVESIKKLELIEEDFTYTRKIARSGIKTHSDVSEALLPLLSIQSHPSISEVVYSERLRARLEGLPKDAIEAFMQDSEVDPSEIARILSESI